MIDSLILDFKIQKMLSTGWGPKQIAFHFSMTKWAVYKRIERRIRQKDVLVERREDKKCPITSLEEK